MGLIVGKLHFNGDGRDETLRKTIEKMATVQRHRDRGILLSITGPRYALAMVNSQNTLFCPDGRAREYSIDESKAGGALYAFVDGIVLDVLGHQKRSEGTGYQVRVPLCSAVVAEAFAQYGRSFMEYLEGEFSTAVWDDANQKLYLARDPYGHKPLHYSYDNNTFIFSSEIKGILAGGVKAELDLANLDDFLSLNGFPWPETPFKHIQQVPPGSILEVSKDGMQIYQYWRPEFNDGVSISLEDATAMIGDSVRDAVKKRIIGKETYCFLSGGIDSSAVVSFAAELAQKPVHAISVGFEESEVNELEDAGIMAHHAGIRHHTVIAKPDSFFSMLDTLVFHHDAPFADVSAYPTYYAAQLAREYTDVILTGDGPDQILGGSDHHVAAIKNNFYRSSILRRRLCALTSNALRPMVRNPVPSLQSRAYRRAFRDSLLPVRSAYCMRSFFPPLIKEFLCTVDFLAANRGHDPYRFPERWFAEAGVPLGLNSFLYADVMYYIPDDLMVKVDRMSMAHGLETLSPFQDKGFAVAVNRLPAGYKIMVDRQGRITTKYILKKVCEPRFPREILRKKKQGFAIPLVKWLRQQNGSFLKEILFDPKSRARNIFKSKSVERFVNDFIAGRGDYYYPNAYALVSMLTLELWHRRYIDS